MAVPPDPASALCLSCGLCCDGGLFDRVDLDTADRSRLAEQGIDAPESLPHPCRHFAAPACSIYAVRPSRCAAFRCRVLSSLDDGVLTASSARDLVDEARTMRAQVAALLPDGTDMVQLAQALRTSTLESRTPALFRSLAQFMAFRLFVERHFLEPGSHWLTRTKA